MATICKFCEKNPPIKNSHVISEFMYKHVYDKKGSFVPLSTADFDSPGFEQKGYREPLLCTVCEGIFSKWEKILEKNLVGMSNPPKNGVTVMESVADFDLFAGIYYEQVKRGILSIIWRMGVATGDPWKFYKLGPHADRLKNLLKSPEPIPCEVYPIRMEQLRREGQYSPDLIALSKKTVRMADIVTQTFIGYGFIFYVIMTQGRFPKDKCIGVLNDSGKFYVPKIDFAELDIGIDFDDKFNELGRKFYKTN